jgi:hypothetical protein
VCGYVKEIYRKLGVRNRVAATLVAMQSGVRNLDGLGSIEGAAFGLPSRLE